MSAAPAGCDLHALDPALPVSDCESTLTVLPGVLLKDAKVGVLSAHIAPVEGCSMSRYGARQSLPWICCEGPRVPRRELVLTHVTQRCENTVTRAGVEHQEVVARLPPVAMVCASCSSAACSPINIWYSSVARRSRALVPLFSMPRFQVD